MRPYIALGVGAACIAFAPIFTKLAAAPPSVIALYRVGTAAAVLAPLFWRRYRDGLGQVRWPLAAVALLGGALFAADLALWNTALKMTSAANATLIANTTPIWVGLAAYFWLGERINGRFLVGLVAAMIGAAFVMGDDFMRAVTLGQGDALALGAAFFYSAYILVTKQARNRLDTLFYIWLADMGATLTLGVLTLLAGWPVAGFTAGTYAAMIGLGLLSQTLGVTVIAWATGHLPASFVSVGLLAQPVMVAVLAFYLLGEGLTPLQVAGGLTVLAGIYLAATGQGRRARSAAEERQRELVEAG
jgi:drug/metabolite transporter (DMT)-like permease